MEVSTRMSVSGLGTGLDTAAIVDRIMQVEGRGKVRLEWQRSLWEARRDGWGAIDKLVGALETASSALLDAGAWVDADTARGRIEAWVTAYNGVVDTLAQRTSEQRSTKPANRQEYVAGALANDAAVHEALSVVRRLAGDVVGGVAAARDTLAEIGIDTGALTGSWSKESMTGRLRIDSAKLDVALAGGLADVQALFNGTYVGADRGVARRVQQETRQWRQGGLVDLAQDGASRQVLELQRGIEEVQVRLDRRRAGYEAMFARLEETMSRMQSQGSWLSGQLASL